MHVSFALFADAANLSQEGKLNILGVFDAVHVAQFPAVHSRATIVVRLKGDATDVGQHDFTLRWFNPSGSELWTTTAELMINAPPGHATEMDLPLVMALDLPLDVPGDYVMGIDLDGSTHAETRLHVRGGAAVPMMPPGAMVS
jgi:hypothetical protein